jgi:hypothetical protein
VRPAPGDKLGGSSPRRALQEVAGVEAAAQPSLSIIVEALNDADGDGIFSESETAAGPGADVSFKAVITNSGVSAFEIAAVSQAFTQPSGRVQVEVCPDLHGLTLGLGESLACSFTVENYSPPVGETVVNTVTASALEIGGTKRRGTSDSDNTTVGTFLEDQVLGVVIRRSSGALAFTGTDAARLLALGLLLLVSGGTALHLARVRQGRSSRPVLRLGPWLRSSAAAPRPRSATRSGRP